MKRGIVFAGRELRPPGQRILKSTLAVFFCLLYGYFRQGELSVFFACIAAVYALRTDFESTWASALDRVVGTGIGVLFGLLAIQIQLHFGMSEKGMPYYLLLTFICMLNLWVVATFFRPGGAFVASIALFSVALYTNRTLTPESFALYRFVDTVVGVLSAVFVNKIWPPSGPVTGSVSAEVAKGSRTSESSGTTESSELSEMS